MHQNQTTYASPVSLQKIRIKMSSHTGKPVEGRVVDVIPTKTSGLGKRKASISHEGTVTGNNRVACVIGSCSYLKVVISYV